MMGLYSVVLDAMGAACFTVAVSEILIHFRRKGRSFSLSLGIASLFTAAYCLMCAGQYNVAEPAQSFLWLRAESFFLSLMAISFLWFISDVTGVVQKWQFRAIAAWFAICAAVQAVGLGDLTWIVSRPDVKEVFLPFGLKLVYKELTAGPLTAVQSMSGVIYFIYLFLKLGRYRASGHRKEARSLLIVVCVIAAAVLNDLAVSLDLYVFMYMTEFAWLAAILFVGFERSTLVLQAAEARDALVESEEKFRSLIEQSSEAIILSDENGVVMEYNHAAEELTGIFAEEALGRKLSDFMGSFPLVEPSEIAEKTLEGSLRRPDGTVRFFRQNLFPIQTKRGYRMGTIIHDVTEEKTAGDRVVASLQEKSVLLKEIHHRVKNNLQVISSLLYLHESRAQDLKYKAILRDCRNQIISMALIHEDLYRSSDFRNINFGGYIRKLTGRLIGTFGVEGRVELEFIVDDIPMSIEKAIPAGLILNEICMNAFKHAFPAGFPVEDPRLTIALHEHGGGAVELSIRDNGVGLPKDLDFRETHSVGMQIVMTLVRQLQGNIRLEPGPGTWFTIEFQARDAG